MSRPTLCGGVVVGWLRIGDTTGPNDGGKAVLLGPGGSGTWGARGERGRAGVGIRWRALREVM